MCQTGGEWQNVSPVTAKDGLDMAVLAFYIAAEDVFFPLFFTSKTEHFSFKSGCVIRVVNHLKEDWFIVLQ